MLIDAIAASLTPQVTFAMVGGFVGALFGVVKNSHGYAINTLMVAIGIMSASAVGDYLCYAHDVHSVFVVGVVNIPVGLVSGFLIDALEVASPRLAQKVVNKLDKKIDEGDL